MDTDASTWPPRHEGYAYAYDDEDDEDLRAKPILNSSPWTYTNGLNPTLRATSSAVRPSSSLTQIRKGNEGYEVKNSSAAFTVDDNENEQWKDINGRYYKVYNNYENDSSSDDYGSE